MAYDAEIDVEEGGGRLRLRSYGAVGGGFFSSMTVQEAERFRDKLDAGIVRAKLQAESARLKRIEQLEAELADLKSKAPIEEPPA